LVIVAKWLHRFSAAGRVGVKAGGASLRGFLEPAVAKSVHVQFRALDNTGPACEHLVERRKSIDFWRMPNEE